MGVSLSILRSTGTTKCSHIHLLYSTHILSMNTHWSSSSSDRLSLVFISISLFIHCKALAWKCYVYLVLDASVSLPALLSMKLGKEKPHSAEKTQPARQTAVPHRPSRPKPPRAGGIWSVVKLNLPWSFSPSCFWLRSAVWVEEICCVMRRTGVDQLNKSGRSLLVFKSNSDCRVRGLLMLTEICLFSPRDARSQVQSVDDSFQMEV